MSIVLDGQKVPTPELDSVCWMDDPAVPQATDFNTRKLWIRGIVLHTVHGKLGNVRPGNAPASSRAESYAKYQARTARDVSWDYTIDTDGTIVASNDPIRRYTRHATSVNPWTLGIELVQEANGDLWEGQIAVTVKFLSLLTRELARRKHPIQRQIPVDSTGNPVRGIIPRIVNPADAKSVVGIYGHRNQTTNRGPGDPGDHVFRALLMAGYHGFNYDVMEDIKFWKDIQKTLGVTSDGIPGPGTAAALKTKGHTHGLWVHQPGD